MRQLTSGELRQVYGGSGNGGGDNGNHYGWYKDDCKEKEKDECKEKDEKEKDECKV